MQEVMNFATHQMFHNQQQALTISGTLKLKSGSDAGKTIALKGLGYRDHTRSMRVDSFVSQHVWSFLYFPKRVFGALTLTGMLRPGSPMSSGYVYDEDGLRSLRDVEIIKLGEGPGKMPAVVEYRLTDVYGKAFTVTGDITGRMGSVPLMVEAPLGNGYSYSVTENFCPVALKETGETGYSLIEIGFNSKQ